MSFEQKYFNALKQEQQAFAIQALSHPPGPQPTVYDYGYRVGVVHGYEKAMELLLNLINEEKNSDRGL